MDGPRGEVWSDVGRDGTDRPFGRGIVGDKDEVGTGVDRGSVGRTSVRIGELRFLIVPKTRSVSSLRSRSGSVSVPTGRGRNRRRSSHDDMCLRKRCSS